MNDLKFALRQLRKNPGFTAVAVLTLALGIGANTAIFSAVDAILIRPLPYADADRLVMVWDDESRHGTPKLTPATAEWIEWRRQNTVFTDIAATQPATAALSGDGEPDLVPARKATANLWSVLGVKPLIGRVFTEEEDEKGVRVALISHGLWQRRYGASPDILGRKIAINDSAYEVIGVMPRNFYFMPARDIDIWMPASLPDWMRTSYGWHDMQVVARLKPGVTLGRARESMAALSRHITEKDSSGTHVTVVTPLRAEMTGKTQTALVVLLCASMALLLIACVNLANLLMSRSVTRLREVAVRAALGAERGRLIAQFLTESVVLAGFGALAGLALAVPAMQFLERLVPETMGITQLTLDWRVLSFSVGMAVASTLTFGLAPALRGSRIDPQEGLREGGRGTSGARSHWFQHSLIVAETALAVVLLTSGGLLLQTFQHLHDTDLGVRREKLLTLETPLFRYGDFEKRVAFVNAELERIRAIPGVVDAAAASTLPLTPNDLTATFYKFAGQTKDEYSAQVALIRYVTRGYLSTMGARLREGRFFDLSDPRAASKMVIVNETFADRNFPGRPAVGARFQFGNLDDQGYWYEIVGVVRQIHEVGMEEEPRPAVYCLHDQPNDQLMIGPSGIVVRTAVEPAAIVSAVRKVIWSVDKNQPIWRVRTLEQILDRQLSTQSQSTTLISVFALLGLLLASLGLYGVLSWAVTQRSNEIGVRMALGATPNDILLAFGVRGLKLTLIGLAIGLTLAFVAVRLLTGLFYGFQPQIVPTAAVVSLVLFLVAALACFIPARRAARVDPMEALRTE